MIPNDTDRVALINSLLEFSTPLINIFEKLKKISWDYDGYGVELKQSHLSSVLQRYVAGDLSATDIEDWANSIEGRDDIRFETSNEQLFEEIIYELANPILTQALNPERGRKILELLNCKKF
jgi:hypothetical protein